MKKGDVNKRWTRPTNAKIILSLLVETKLTPYQIWKRWDKRYQAMFSAGCVYLKEKKVLTESKVPKGKVYHLLSGEPLKRLVAEDFKLYVSRKQKVIRKLKTRNPDIQTVLEMPTMQEAVAVYNCLLLPEFRTYLRTYLNKESNRQKIRSLFEPLNDFLDLHDVAATSSWQTKHYWIKFFTHRCNMSLEKQEVCEFNAKKAGKIVSTASAAFSKVWIIPGVRHIEHYSSSEMKEMREEGFFGEEEGFRDYDEKDNPI